MSTRTNCDLTEIRRAVKVGPSGDKGLCNWRFAKFASIARTFGYLLTAALALPMVGCGCLDWALHSTERIGIHHIGTPNKLLVLLTPQQMKINGAADRQGMMCRVYAFEAGNPVPIQIQGDLSFTAFDQTRTAANRQPDGKYEIPADKLASHMRKDMVGQSYLFWLPYDPVMKTQMSVQAKFTDQAGHEVISDVVTLELEPPVSTTNMPMPGFSAADHRSYREIKMARSDRVEEVSEIVNATDLRQRAATLSAPAAAN